MKKILLLLMLCFSLSFSGVPNEVGYIGQEYYYMNDSAGDVGYCRKKTSVYRTFDYDDWYIKAGGDAVFVYSSNYMYLYSAWRVDPFNGATYAEGTQYNSLQVDNSECELALNPPSSCGPRQIPNEENTGCIADPQYQGNCNEGFIDLSLFDDIGCSCPGGAPKFDGFSFYCPVLMPLGVGDTPDTIIDELTPDNPNETPPECLPPNGYNFYGDCVSSDEPYYNFPTADVNNTVDPLTPLEPVNKPDSNYTDPNLKNTNILLSNIRSDLKSADNEAVKTNSLLTNVRTDVNLMRLSNEQIRDSLKQQHDDLKQAIQSAIEGASSNELNAYENLSNVNKEIRDSLQQQHDDLKQSIQSAIEGASSNELNAYDKYFDTNGTIVRALGVKTGESTVISKLDELINAVNGDNNTTGDVNATGDNDPTGAIDTNSTINVDLNDTNAKLDQLHDDNNQTNSLLSDIKGFFDDNGSDSVDGFNNALPADGWYESNKIDVDFNTYNGDCYLETIMILDEYEFPPRVVIDMLPLNMLGNLFMAVLYLLGLRSFLRN